MTKGHGLIPEPTTELALGHTDKQLPGGDILRAVKNISGKNLPISSCPEDWMYVNPRTNFYGSLNDHTDAMKPSDRMEYWLTKLPDEEGITRHPRTGLKLVGSEMSGEMPRWQVIMLYAACLAVTIIIGYLLGLLWEIVKL